jgi:uncharacterized membrane protein YheB (UPF0754 family)
MEVGFGNNDPMGDNNSMGHPLNSANPEIAAKFTYEMPVRRPYPPVIGFMRKHIFKTYVFVVFAGTTLWLVLDYIASQRAGDGLHGPGGFVDKCKTISVPLVCLLFTWFHVWLALTMMFYPINFIGCCKPYLGWQGIVPRKAGIMAERAATAMLGNIITIEEFMDRVEPEEFFSQLREMLTSISQEVLERVVQKRWPTLWAALPASVQTEIKEKVLEDVKKSLTPAFAELRNNINTILDVKQMAIEALVSNPKMMVDMFREIAPRELIFIQHVAAVMGFLLGLVQMGLYLAFPTDKYPTADYYVLPISGLILGWFTNWLALQMTFRPIWPHMFCDNRINFQGVFLKRQKEAAAKMSELICAKVVDARAMFQYMLKSSGGGVDKLLEIYRNNLTNTIDDSVGFARTVVPTFVGQGIDDLKQDVIDISLELLPAHIDSIEKFMDRTMKIEETLSWRLARLQPPEFEDIVHPIFKDDEWILLLVGALLGIVIGIAQAYILSIIH